MEKLIRQKYEHQTLFEGAGLGVRSIATLNLSLLRVIKSAAPSLPYLRNLSTLTTLGLLPLYYGLTPVHSSLSTRFLNLCSQLTNVFTPNTTMQNNTICLNYHLFFPLQYHLLAYNKQLKQ